jgi:iron(III) transport system substrate-binding protein
MHFHCGEAGQFVRKAAKIGSNAQQDHEDQEGERMSGTLRALVCGAAIALLGGPALAEDFSLDALIAAARAEAPLNVYDSTGKIVDMAKNFAAAYGLQANGVKARAADQLETVIREVQAGNVQTGVVLLADVPAAVAQLLPDGIAESWLPPDLAEDIDPLARDPLLVVASPYVFAYNTALNQSCPISNIWQLTDAEWKGKVVLEDPLRVPTYTDWYSQMESHADDRMAAAYEALYGKPLETTYKSATEAFVAALAENGPLITDTDNAAAEAVAAPGQTENFVSMITAAKFRENAASGFTLGLCTGMKPFIGFNTAKVALMPKGTPSPNAAKLFMHFIMTEPGIEPQLADGKISFNTAVPMSADEPSGLGAHLDEMLGYDASTGQLDWDTRQDWQDFWRLHYSR